MTDTREIPIRNGAGGSRRKMSVSNSYDMNNMSTSPIALLRSPSYFSGHPAAAAAKQLKPFHTQDIKVLLLENVNAIGQSMLKQQGYQVEAFKSSLPENELIEKIK